MNKISDTYQTIEGVSISEYKEKGSKFLGYAFHIETEEDFFAKLDTIKNEHIKARHFCYAYEIGISGNRHRSNDDGEPSGTAGKPILGQIHSHSITDVGIIVVRYFGGTKLGASGLISAYKETARAALSQGQTIEKKIFERFELSFGYDHMGQILSDLKNQNLQIFDKTFEANCTVVIGIPASTEEAELLTLKANWINVSISYVDMDTEIPFCTIKKLTPCSKSV